MPMKFINTNDYFSGKTGPERYSLREVLLKGQAPGKGLFVPEKIVSYSDEMIRGLSSRPYHEVAFPVLYPYFDDIPADDFRRILQKTYGSIQAPLKEMEPSLYCLELFHNWTFAFKDFAAQLLASVIEYYLGQEDREIIVFVGTSGDTGPAIDEAFLDKKGIRVYCLYPAGRVTEIQKKQMTALGQNIYPVEVKGDFHDCQEMAKSALSDPELEAFSPTSANSINWGRFIPQSVFSFWLYSRVAQPKEEIIVSIPTGNAGHIGSNFLAWAGGLPIVKFVAPHNENNYLVRMLEQGKEDVEVRDTVENLSNAMNVKKPNNIPRILYIFNRDLEKMRSMIYPVTVSDEETRKAIRAVYKEKGYIMDVHSAVAWSGTLRFREECPEFRSLKTGVFFTAHPAKFSGKIRDILGVPPPLPEKLKARMIQPDRNLEFLEAGDMKGLKEIVFRTARPGV